MIYLLRKSLSQQRCSQSSPWCPVDQLDQPLIRGTTPNYATRELHNTDRLPSHTFQSKQLSCISILCSNQLPPASVWLPLFPACVVLVRPSGSTAARLLPCSRCHAQVIRPHYEDICAALINTPIVLPPKLSIPVLLSPW